MFILSMYGYTQVGRRPVPALLPLSTSSNCACRRERTLGHRRPRCGRLPPIPRRQLGEWLLPSTHRIWTPIRRRRCPRRHHLLVPARGIRSRSGRADGQHDVVRLTRKKQLARAQFSYSLFYVLFFGVGCGGMVWVLGQFFTLCFRRAEQSCGSRI